VNVSASDASGNIAWNNSTIYTALPKLTGSISGMKFNDSNGNGTTEPGEPGLPNWTIVLRNSNGEIVFTNMTDNNGSYTFGELATGNYTVEEVLQSGWTQSRRGRPATSCTTSSVALAGESRHGGEALRGFPSTAR
jgi:hypothetical protein